MDTEKLLGAMAAADTVAAAILPAVKVTPHPLAVDRPQMEGIGQAALKGIDEVTAALCAQIDAAVSELQSVRAGIMSHRDEAHDRIEKLVHLGGAAAEIVARIRTGVAGEAAAQ